MTLEILQVPGCPGADRLAARLDGLLAGRLRVTRRVVTSEADAERLGMTGSPTLLADGADPFARPGQLPSVVLPSVPRRARPPGPRPLHQPAPRRSRPVTASCYPCGAGGMPSATSIAFSARTESQ